MTDGHTPTPSGLGEIEDRVGAAFFDLREGWNWGLHRALNSHSLSKMMYALMALVIWLLFGSTMFAFLEASPMVRYQHGTHDFDAIIATLHNVSNFTQDLTTEQREHLTHAANWMGRHQPAQVTWGLVGGFFFSVLSITTIGYGRFLCPHTILGKLFVIPYTLVGIPIIGIFYTVWATHTLEKIKQRLAQWQGDPDTQESGDQLQAMNRSMMVAFCFLFLLLLLVGPGVFMITEGWEYYEAVYFVWVSISTIGYGDYVPQSQEGKILGIMLIPFGLGVVALVFTSISQFFEDMFLYVDYNVDTALSDTDESGGKLDYKQSPYMTPRKLDSTVAMPDDVVLNEDDHDDDTTPLLANVRGHGGRAQQRETKVEQSAPHEAPGL